MEFLLKKRNTHLTIRAGLLSMIAGTVREKKNDSSALEKRVRVL